MFTVIGSYVHDIAGGAHGSTAKGKWPNLHSETIRNAKPGELQWLLTNGSLAKGMPSWSRLPEQQRWQLVRYLKTLQVGLVCAAQPPSAVP